VWLIGRGLGGTGYSTVPPFFFVLVGSGWLCCLGGRLGGRLSRCRVVFWVVGPGTGWLSGGGSGVGSGLSGIGWSCCLGGLGLVGVGVVVGGSGRIFRVGLSW